EELAVCRIGIAGTGHADDAAFIRHVGKFGVEVRIFRAAGAVAVLPIAGLRHETIDDAVERHVVIEAVARELRHALGVMRRNVVAKLDDDPALGRIENQRALWIETGGKRWGGVGWHCTYHRNEYGKDADHLISRVCSSFWRTWSSAVPQLARAQRPRHHRPCRQSGAPTWR